MVNIFPPLSTNHPLVRDGHECWICRRNFSPHQRTVLIEIEMPVAGSLTVEAKLVHATCAVRGRKVFVGGKDRIADYVKEGDGSPFPLVTTDGQQWKVEEAKWP